MAEHSPETGAPASRTAYLAPEGYVAESTHELGEIERAHERLLIAPGPKRPAAWARNVWLDPVTIPIASIGDAARRLRAIQRNWAVYAPLHHRRAMLIQERLPSVSAQPLVFGRRHIKSGHRAASLLNSRRQLADRGSPRRNLQPHSDRVRDGRNGCHGADHLTAEAALNDSA